MADARRSNFELEKRTGLREVEVERNRLTSLQPNENISFDRAIQQLQEGQRFSLRDITLQRAGLEAQLAQGLRDIGQAETAGIENVRADAADRGIFRSGIRETDEAEVAREAGEARSDLRSSIDRALQSLVNRTQNVNTLTSLGIGQVGTDRATADINRQAQLDQLANREDFIRNKQFIEASGGGGVGGLFDDFLAGIEEFILSLLGDAPLGPPPAFPDSPLPSGGAPF